MGEGEANEWHEKQKKEKESGRQAEKDKGSKGGGKEGEGSPNLKAGIEERKGAGWTGKEERGSWCKMLPPGYHLLPPAYNTPLLLTYQEQPSPGCEVGGCE